MKKTKGFITLATGNKHYYLLATNLLSSYRAQAEEPRPFAIIAEEENEYTRLFDDTVIIHHPERSFMDKVRLLENLPYDENIFIDADCLVYKDINYLWNLFDESIGVFSAIGEELPLDSENGWFTKESIGTYANQIGYIAHLHGGLYFLRKERKEAEAFLKTCEDIIVNYQNYHFRMFDKPADEPVLALAMAAHHLPMVKYSPEIMCFYPSVTTFYADIRKQKAIFEIPWHQGKIEGSIVHWGNYNTKRAVYIRECERLECSSPGCFRDFRINSKYAVLRCKERLKNFARPVKKVLNSLFTNKQDGHSIK